jgi:hypothetical protein
MPVDIVSVAESEVAAYRAGLPEGFPILPHPDDVVGYGSVCRWILQTVDADPVVYCDDDVTGVVCLVGRRSRKITDRDAIRQILTNAATVCQGMGARLFSFAITANVLDFYPDEPFLLNKGGGPVRGVFGKDSGYDPRLTYHVDPDLTLTCLLRDRLVFKDTRFCFEAHFQDNLGGSQDLFSPEIFNRDVRRIHRKWGPPEKYWKLRDTKKKGPQGFPIRRLQTCVSRRQGLSIK